jgi:hypothetical protein
MDGISSYHDIKVIYISKRETLGENESPNTDINLLVRIADIVVQSGLNVEAKPARIRGA